MNFLNRFAQKQIISFCILFIGSIFLYNYTQIFDFKPDLNGDNAYYYSLAKSLLEGKGYTNIISSNETPHTHFPPGYPAFGALILMFFKSYISLKIANGVLLFLSILLLFSLIRRISDSTLLALCSAVLCCMQPELLRYATIVMSEMLFTFLSLLVLYLASKIDTNRLFWGERTRSQLYLFAGMTIFLCYIYLVRTMGASIILSIFIFYGILCIRQGFQYFKQRKTKEDRIRMSTTKKTLFSNIIVLAVLVGAFIGTKAGWDVRNRNLGVSQNDYLNDFKKKPKGEKMSTLSDWTQRARNNIVSYTTKWIPSAVLPYDYESQKTPATRDWARGILVVILIVLGLERVRKVRLLLFLYIGITMGVLLIWPEQYAGHRYFIGLIPLLIFLFLSGILEITSSILKKLPAFRRKELVPPAILAMLSIFLLIPQYTTALEDQKYFARYKTWNEKIAPEAFVEYAYAINWCKTNLPDTARIACRKADLFYLFSGGHKAETFPQYGKPENIFEGFKNAGITHVIIDRWFRHGYVTIYPLVSEYYPEYFRPLVQFGKNTEKQLPTLIFEFNPNGFVHSDSTMTKN